MHEKQRRGERSRCLGSDGLFRGHQRRAQSALVQVLLVFRVMLRLSVCLSGTVSLSWLLLEE